MGSCKRTPVKIMLDSGAHSFMMRHNKQQLNNPDWSFWKTKEFKTFLEEYIKFLHTNKTSIFSYVGLDVIRNEKATREVIDYMNSCGLYPIPVIHYGASVKTLEYYLSTYDYVGFSGLSKFLTKRRHHIYLKDMMASTIDAHGKPCVKMHCFALMTPERILAYPWYSYDSTTWRKMAAYGQVTIPKTGKDGAYDYMQPVHYKISTKRKKLNEFIHRASEYVGEWLQSVPGYTYSEAEQNHETRSFANLHYWSNVQARVKEIYEERYNYREGGNLFLASAFTSTWELQLPEWLLQRGLFGDSLNLLVSYFFKPGPQRLIDLQSKLSASGLISCEAPRRIQRLHNVYEK